MVLEHLLPDDWLERKARFAFLLGLVYSLVGILLASFIFPKDPALASVAFVSLLMYPELSKLFALEEKREKKRAPFSWRRLFADNKGFVRTYLLLFLGVFIGYAMMTMVLDNFAANTLFRAQLEIMGSYGRAVALPGSLFATLLVNNVIVLFACFLLSLVSGDGAVFFITWNASVWGTIFGTMAKHVSAATMGSPLPYFLLILLIVSPHMVLEALSYIMAAISGGTISKDVLLEKFDSARFNRVFLRNAALLAAAFAVLLVAVLVETLVLANSGPYQWMIRMVY